MAPAKQLAAFLAKFSPEVAAQARAALAVMRARFRGALELVYDNYNALAIGWAPTERASDVICSIAVFPRWVSVFFFDGPRLPDPKKILRGGGTKVRHLVLGGATTLDAPAVQALLREALKRRPLDPAQKHRIIIKSISAKQRPRRPAPSAVARARRPAKLERIR